MTAKKKNPAGKTHSGSNDESLCVMSLLSVMKNGGSSGENGHVR